ncbi:MAG: hypothetical protein NVSMB10_13390 [Steroidobacteraceae bacterium]
MQVIRHVDELGSLRGDYAHLQSATGNTLPFALYDWHVLWCRHFLRREPTLTDELVFHLLRDSAGTCVALLPFVWTRRRVGAFTFSSLELLGADPAITEIRTALVQPGYEEATAQMLQTHFQPGDDCDWIQWMGARDRFSAALAERRGLDWRPLEPGYVLDLPPSWDEFRAGLKRNIRESLRHCYNSLKRADFKYSFDVADDPDAVRKALEPFFILHGLRAGMRSSVPHPNRFESQSVRRFVIEVCEQLAALGMTRIFQLKINGEIVAARIGFVVRDSLYLYYSGFDPAWHRYSVMTTVTAEAIKYAINLGLKTVNLSPGSDISKTRWGPRIVPYEIAYQPGSRLRSRVASNAYRKARSGEGLQGWLLQRLVKARRSWH